MSEFKYLRKNLNSLKMPTLLKETFQKIEKTFMKPKTKQKQLMYFYKDFIMLANCNHV